MYPKKCPRRLQQFLYLLLLAYLTWGGLGHDPHVKASLFEPIVPSGRLSQDIAPGVAPLSQYQQLRQISLDSKVYQEKLQQIFEENFHGYGVYGELKNGIIVDDWEGFGKLVGLPGDKLAEAYQQWWKTQQDELEGLTRADQDFLDRFFYSFSGKEVDWERFAKDKKLPGLGLLLTSLYLLWKKRKTHEEEPAATPEVSQAIQNFSGRFEAFKQHLQSLFANKQALLVEQQLEALEPQRPAPPEMPPHPIEPVREPPPPEFELFLEAEDNAANQAALLEQKQQELTNIESIIRSPLGMASFFQRKADDPRMSYWSRRTYQSLANNYYARSQQLRSQHAGELSRLNREIAEQKSVLAQAQEQVDQYRWASDLKQQQDTNYAERYAVYWQAVLAHRAEVARRRADYERAVTDFEGKVNAIKAEAKAASDSWWHYAKDHWDAEVRRIQENNEFSRLRAQLADTITQAQIRQQSVKKSAFLAQIKNIFGNFSDEQIQLLTDGKLAPEVEKKDLPLHEIKALIDGKGAEIKAAWESLTQQASFGALNETRIYEIETEINRTINSWNSSWSNRQFAQAWNDRNSDNANLYYFLYQHPYVWVRGEFQRLVRLEEEKKSLQSLVAQAQAQSSDIFDQIKTSFTEKVLEQNLSQTRSALMQLRSEQIQQLEDEKALALKHVEEQALEVYQQTVNQTRQKYQYYYWDHYDFQAQIKMEQTIKEAGKYLDELYGKKRETHLARFDEFLREFDDWKAKVDQKNIQQTFLRQITEKVDYETPLEKMFPPISEPPLPDEAVLEEHATLFFESAEIIEQLKTEMKAYETHAKNYTSYANDTGNSNTRQSYLSSAENFRRLAMDHASKIAALQAQTEEAEDLLWKHPEMFLDKVNKTYNQKKASLMQEKNEKLDRTKKHAEDHIRSLGGYGSPYSYQYRRNYGLIQTAKHNLEHNLAYYAAQYDEKIAALREWKNNLAPQIQQKIQEREIEKARAVAERQKLVSEYQTKRAQAPVALRTLSFLKRLSNAKDQSQYFSDTLQAAKNLPLYQEELSLLNAQLAGQSDFAKAIAELEAKIAEGNDMTFQQYLERSPNYYARERGTLWYVEDNWKRQKSAVARSGGDYWQRRYGKYVHSLMNNQTPWTPEIEQNIRQLQQKVDQELSQRWQGWEDYYKVHPNQYAEQLNEWKTRLMYLKEAEAKRTSLLQQHTEQLRQMIEEEQEDLFQAKKWLEQTTDQRLGNEVTRFIVDTELGDRVVYRSSPEGMIGEIDAQRTELEQSLKENLNDQVRSHLLAEASTPSYTNRIIAQLKHFATPAFQAERTQRLYNRDENDRVSHAEAVALGKSIVAAASGGNASSVQVYHRITSHDTTTISQRVKVVAAPTRQNASGTGPPPPTDPSKIQLVDASPYEQSSFDPASIAASRPVSEAYASGGGQVVIADPEPLEGTFKPTEKEAQQQETLAQIIDLGNVETIGNGVTYTDQELEDLLFAGLPRSGTFNNAQLETIVERLADILDDTAPKKQLTAGQRSQWQGFFDDVAEIKSAQIRDDFQATIQQTPDQNWSIKDASDFAGGTLKGLWKGLKGDITGIGDLWTLVKALPGITHKFLTALWDLGWEGLKEVLKTTTEALGKAFGYAKDEIGNLLEKTKEALKKVWAETDPAAKGVALGVVLYEIIPWSKGLRALKAGKVVQKIEKIIDDRITNLVKGAKATKHIDDAIIEKALKKISDKDEAFIINSDNYKKDIPGYREGIDDDLVQPRVQNISEKIYTQALQSKEKDTVIFAAGGPASGKSTLLVNKLKYSATKSIIFDGTFSDFEKSTRKIEQALQAGKKVHISAVYIDPALAFEFAQERARDVSSIFAPKHAGFRETIYRLAQQYEDIEIDVIINEGKSLSSTLTKEFPDRASLLAFLKDKILTEEEILNALP